MKIAEKFVSLQGEGRYQGYPTAFIRCHGCNLRCNWCDTRYATFDKGHEEGITPIAKWIEETGITNVCITGGEPLLQIGTIWTLLDMLDEKYKVCIETNGATKLYNYSQEEFKCDVQIVMDWKMPSSGMFREAYDQTIKNVDLLCKGDEVKFVIADENDYNTAIKHLKHIPSDVGILFSPLQKYFDKFGRQRTDGLELGKLAKWMIDDKLNNVRMNLQLHKIIWPDVERGV